MVVTAFYHPMLESCSRRYIPATYNSGTAFGGESDYQLRYDASETHSKNTYVSMGNCDATTQYIAPRLNKSFPRRDSNPGRPGESRVS